MNYERDGMYPQEYTLSVTGNLGKGFAASGDLLIPKEATAFLRDHGGVPGARRPDVSLVFQILDGQLTTVLVTFSTSSLTRQVRQGDFEGIDLEAIKRRALSDLVLEYDKATDLATYQTERKRGRKKINELAESANAPNTSEFVAVASVFCDPKNRANRSQAVKTQLGYGSIATANRRIKEARDKGWIPAVGSSSEDFNNRFEELQPDYKTLQQANDDAS
jgi:hypothetical protein